MVLREHCFSNCTFAEVVRMNSDCFKQELYPVVLDYSNALATFDKKN